MFFRLSIFLLLLCNQGLHWWQAVPCSLCLVKSILPGFQSTMVCGTPSSLFPCTQLPHHWDSTGMDKIWGGLSGSFLPQREVGEFSKEAGGLFYRGSLPTAVPLLLLFTLLVVQHWQVTVTPSICRSFIIFTCHILN